MGEKGFEEETEREANIRALRSIRDSNDSTSSEKTSAIKELRMILGDDDSRRGGGPGDWTRAELEAELRRLRALTAG